jgi:asparagine synthase (glutamine-hydrolysing)
MCGIAGILRLDGGPVDAGPLGRLIGALAHRGPDGSGIHIAENIGLAHRRLSILDPTEAGRQPMFRGRVALVHNGEIYNYQELAAELRDRGEPITTGTDTEVMLAAYRAWGPEAIKRFNGMFAFALWDPERRRLILARDRMGVKPVYLRRTRHLLAFASEPAAFLAAGHLDADDTWSPEPNLGVVHDFLARGRTERSTATFFDGVTSLPPAHILVIEDGRERLIRYWGPPTLADDDRPVVRGTDLKRDGLLVEEFRETFDSSVRLRLRSDVPIGTCLSGGLDSSAIVTTVATLRESDLDATHARMPRLGFHARFPADGIDESAFAELVAGRAGIRLVHTTPSGNPLLRSVLPVLRAQGEPFVSTSVIAQHAVMAAAHREQIKVLLDGQGADELLGGYTPYLGERTAGLLLAAHPVDAARELRAQVRRGPLSTRSAILATVRAAMPADGIELARRMARGRYGVRCGRQLAQHGPLSDGRREPGTRLAAHLWDAVSVGPLPALLRYEDRNSMAFGIEARVPFLDVRLVELAVGLPDRLRIDQGVTKAILRRAIGPRLPDEVTQRRDKLGFAAPEAAWLAAGSTDVAALIRGGQVTQRGWVAPAEVERVLDAGLADGRRTEHLWRLFMMEAWLRMMWPGSPAVGGRSTWEGVHDGDA